MPSVHAKARHYLESIFAKKMPSDIDPKQLHEVLTTAKTFRLLSVSTPYDALLEKDLEYVY